MSSKSLQEESIQKIITSIFVGTGHCGVYMCDFSVVGFHGLTSVGRQMSKVCSSTAENKVYLRVPEWNHLLCSNKHCYLVNLCMTVIDHCA